MDKRKFNRVAADNSQLQKFANEVIDAINEGGGGGSEVASPYVLQDFELDLSEEIFSCSDADAEYIFKNNPVAISLGGTIAIAKNFVDDDSKNDHIRGYTFFDLEGEDQIIYYELGLYWDGEEYSFDVKPTDPIGGGSGGGSDIPYEVNVSMGQSGMVVSQDDLDYIKANWPAIIRFLIDMSIMGGTGIFKWDFYRTVNMGSGMPNVTESYYVCYTIPALGTDADRINYQYFIIDENSTTEIITHDGTTHQEVQVPTYITHSINVNGEVEGNLIRAKWNRTINPVYQKDEIYKFQTAWLYQNVVRDYLTISNKMQDKEAIRITSYKYNCQFDGPNKLETADIKFDGENNEINLSVTDHIIPDGGSNPNNYFNKDRALINISKNHLQYKAHGEISNVVSADEEQIVPQNVVEFKLEDTATTGVYEPSMTLGNTTITETELAAIKSGSIKEIDADITTGDPIIVNFRNQEDLDLLKAGTLGQFILNGYISGQLSAKIGLLFTSYTSGTAKYSQCEVSGNDVNITTLEVNSSDTLAGGSNMRSLTK